MLIFNPEEGSSGGSSVPPLLFAASDKTNDSEDIEYSQPASGQQSPPAELATTKRDIREQM